jgi:hypothetical protein
MTLALRSLASKPLRVPKKEESQTIGIRGENLTAL